MPCRIAAQQLAKGQGKGKVTPNWGSGSQSSSVPAQMQFGMLTCTICMETLVGDADDRIANMACQHSFHLVCIDEWAATELQEERVAQCPICRQPFEVAHQYTRTAPDEHAIFTPPRLRRHKASPQQLTARTRAI